MDYEISPPKTNRDIPVFILITLRSFSQVVILALFTLSNFRLAPIGKLTVYPAQILPKKRQRSIRFLISDIRAHYK